VLEDAHITVSQDKVICVEEDGYEDDLLKIFDLKQEKWITQWSLEADPLRLFTLSNPNYLVTVSDVDIKMWNLEKQECQFEVTRFDLCVDSVIELYTNHLIFISGEDQGIMEVWDIIQNKCLLQKICKKSEGIYLRKVTDRYFITQPNPCALQIYEIETCKLIKTLKFTKIVECITNGVDQLIIGFHDGTIEFWGGS